MPAVSPWGSRLESKLAALAATSSNETLLTLSKWIAFNRKRAKKDFAPVFVASLKQESKQEMILGVINEVLLLNRSMPSKWDRLEDLRVTLGEQVLLVTADQLSDSVKNKVMKDLWKEWDDANSFGGPTVLNLLKKKLSSSNKQPSVTEKAAESPSKVIKAAGKQAPPKAPPPENSVPASPKKKMEVSSPLPKAKPVRKPIASPPKKVASYDFEARGIPAAKVESQQFQEPCRAIATLQIARDLRNDGAVQLSSLLSGMPKDIRAACADAAENDNKYELEEARARDFSLRINSSLLDMDMDEQLQNVQTFRNIVDRQRQAREQVIRLLIQSRCKFGAEEAAEAFYVADRAKEELLKRKHILSDAMELEGLDVGVDESGTAADKADEEELAPFSWYAKGQKASDEPNAKRARTEES